MVIDDMNENVFAFFFIVVFALGIGSFLYRWYRYGGFTAAFLGAPITRTVGEVILSKTAFSSSVLRVHALGPGKKGPSAVGLVLIAKAPLGGSMMPIAMTVDQARRLAEVLNATVEEATATTPESATRED